MRELVFRPLISVVRVSPEQEIIEVTLDLEGWIADGTAVATSGESPLWTAGRATCEAVSRMLPEGTEVSVEWLEYLPSSAQRPDGVVLSVTRVHGEDEDDRLIGAAFVRSNVQVAAVRATLDGLTRRLALIVAARSPG